MMGKERSSVSKESWLLKDSLKNMALTTTNYFILLIDSPQFIHCLLLQSTEKCRFIKWMSSQHFTRRSQRRYIHEATTRVYTVRQGGAHLQAQKIVIQSKTITSLLEWEAIYISQATLLQTEWRWSLSSLKKKKLQIIAVYVGDLILIAETAAEIWEMKRCLSDKFKMKDMGRLKYCLGVNFNQANKCVSLSQKQYLQKLLKKFGITDANEWLHQWMWTGKEW